MVWLPSVIAEPCRKEYVLIFAYDRQLTHLQPNLQWGQTRRITYLITNATQRDSNECYTKKHKLNFHCHL